MSADPAWDQIALAILAAPLVGSFLGVLIRRVPAGRPWILARSACDQCGIALGAAALIPLWSYWRARGRCRTCGGAIGWFHPAIELAALAVAAVAAGVDGDQPVRLWLDIALGWSLLTLGWIDADSGLLPDGLTLPLLLAGLAEAALWEPDALTPRAAAAALGWAALAGVGWLYRRRRGRDGLGEGDPRLYAAAGAWLGPEGLGPVLLLAVAVTGAMAGLAAFRGRPLTRATALPFGPGLAVGFWLLWLVGG